MNSETPNPWRAFAIFGAIGFELAVCIMAGLFVGRSLDRLWGTDPLFFIVGLLSGLFTGIVSMILLIKHYLGDS